MRCHLLLGFAVFAGLAASPVSARYGYCEVYSMGSDRLFLTGILDFGEDLENVVAIRRDFSGVVNRPVNRIECQAYYARAHEAKDAKKRQIEAKLAVTEDTDWTGRYAATGSVEKPKPSGAFISVKDNDNAARAKAWDDAVLEGQRQEAQRKVLDAASNSQNDAKTKALIAAFMERLRKQGRRQ